jgi:hypothetical protein
MEVAGLVLAIPPLLVGIRKCITKLDDAHKSFVEADERLQNILLRCRLLDAALTHLQNQTGGGSLSDPLLSQIGQVCSKRIGDVEELANQITAKDSTENTNDSSLPRAARWDFLWKRDDFKLLAERLNECVENIHLYLSMAHLSVTNTRSTDHPLDFYRIC